MFLLQFIEQKFLTLKLYTSCVQQQIHQKAFALIAKMLNKLTATKLSLQLIFKF